MSPKKKINRDSFCMTANNYKAKHPNQQSHPKATYIHAIYHHHECIRCWRSGTDWMARLGKVNDVVWMQLDTKESELPYSWWYIKT